MFPVNCPKTRNEEFGQLLEALTEKYCQTVMKLDELIEQFDTLRGKNDKVIKFQEENFHKHDSGLDHVLDMHKSLEERQKDDHLKTLQVIETENVKLKETIASQESKLIELMKEQGDRLKSEDDKQICQIRKIEEEKKLQDTRIESSHNKIDQLKTNISSHSEILEALIKELKEKDLTIAGMEEKLDQLMKERDGGNDVIKEEFDEKLQKVVDQVQTKASTVTVNELMSKHSEELSNVKETFNDKLESLGKKQEGIEAKQTDTETKLDEIVKKSETFNETSVQTTNEIKGDQSLFKEEVKSLRRTQDENEKERLNSTSQINDTIKSMNDKQNDLSSNFGKLEGKVNHQMENIDNKTAETQNNLKDLQHVTNTFDDKVANFSKSLRMEFRETKDDMVKKIDEHVQLAIQDSRARNEDLEDRVSSNVKKQEVVLKSLESQVKMLESEQKNIATSSQGKAFFRLLNTPWINCDVIISDEANILLFHGLQLVSYRRKESF